MSACEVPALDRALVDERLSYRARGILAVLVLARTGWEASIAALTERGVEGRDAVRTAVNELVDLGYLERVRTQDHLGRITHSIRVAAGGPA